MTNQCQNDEYPRRCGIWISDLIRHSSFWFRHFRAGQGLLETTIAIGVITTGLFAVITLVLSNARSSDEAELRFAAVQLAREGIEVVRAQRDSNWLAGSAWDVGIIDGGVERSVRVNPLDSNQSFVEESDITNDTALVRRNGEFLAQGTEGDPTPFRRLVTLTPICNDRTMPDASACAETNPMIGVRVRSRVTWSIRGQTKEVAIEEMLYNWR